MKFPGGLKFSFHRCTPIGSGFTRVSLSVHRRVWQNFIAYNIEITITASSTLIRFTSFDIHYPNFDAKMQIFSKQCNFVRHYGKKKFFIDETYFQNVLYDDIFFCKIDMKNLTVIDVWRNFIIHYDCKDCSVFIRRRHMR